MMICETKLLLVLPLLLLVTNCMQQSVYGEPQEPCIFVFGDSLSDNGNNNNLPTAAKCNYNPYGIDFPVGPTGRFTNGETVIDKIGQQLGSRNYIPPFANTSGSDILKGVNYASGAAGIRNETGTHLGAVISLGNQLINHNRIVSRIATKHIGFNKTKQHLNKCLYYVHIGNNDYINNYFLPEFYRTSSIYTLEQYTQDLINRLSQFLQALRVSGARKYAIVGAGLIGCTPDAISKRGTNGSCVEKENAAAFNFNDKAKSLVDKLNNKFSSDSKFIFINSTAGKLDSLFGFTVSNAGCCPTREDGQCIPNEMPCQNRDEYVFWDGFHPTEAVNLITAIASYNGSDPTFTHPMDIKHLVES